MNSAVKEIIVADDFPVVRTGLQKMLEKVSGLVVSDEASTCNELITKLQTCRFDVVVADVAMEGGNAINLLTEIKQQWPLLPVVVFTMYPDEGHALRAIKAGASAYIQKTAPLQQVVDTIRTVANGKKYFTPKQVEMLSDVLTSPNELVLMGHEQLTDREFQVMFMLASGFRKTHIAEKLQLSKNTVGNHRNNILRKMNLSGNSDLTRYAIRHGIIK
jgi:two-component system, NarL family, invasion response regulator UvrY